MATGPNSGGQIRLMIYYERLVTPGGAERVAIEEAKYFGRRYETELLTFGISDPVLTYAQGRIPQLRLIGRADSRAGTYEGNRLNVKETLKRAVKLRTAIARYKPNVILGSAWGGWISLYLATLFSRTPYVLHVHGTTYLFNEGVAGAVKYSFQHRAAFDVLRSSTPGHREFISARRPRNMPRPALELLALVDSLAIKRARAVIVVSERGRKELRHLYGRDSIKLPITEIRNLPARPKIDVKDSLGIPDRRMLLSVSRLEKIKRVDVLIEAFASIARELPDVVLVVVGTGPERERLAALVEHLGLGDRVIFSGFIPDELLREYYSACDVFAYAGWSDLVLTIFEALAANKPILCSTEIEAEDWMTKSGLLVMANPNVQDFAEGLRSIFNSKPVPLPVRKPSMDEYLDKVLEICVKEARH